MKLRFSKRDKLILGAGALLLVLLIVYAQFFSLSPLKSDLGMKKQTLTTLQKLLDVVSQNKAEDTQKTAEDTRELQKVLPVKPLQEQLLLDLEKAETLSNSKISSIGFSKEDANTAAEQTNAENTNGQQTAGSQDAANKTAANQGTTNQDASADKKPDPSQPAALKKLTVSLSVESPTYKDFEKFIETLESLKRIVVVESISYTGGQEITSLEQEVKPISYSLTISAFYMPNLADLAADLPKIDAPAPAGKDNPLSEFPATTQTQP
ncbi:pilus assembly protein PilO [Neobacillus sp. WH10]|uniref:pilus assembly protein PilO n=1 Tax=Neobacillus sp. WH10 TaxID=3047873 RepID=UPI0024C1F281|nr:pilus assembly protein PilO [Neobacillus sp. WH10]WHY76347.1 pilus assembly protein PilO [Neobacillus sp. WH10]